MNSSAQNLKFVVVISLVAAIGGFLFGFDSGVINGTVDGLKIAFNSDSVGTGLNVASMLLGCAAGALVAGRLADIFGRKRLLQVSAILFFISAWGSGIADSSVSFIIYRIIGGLGVGAASVMAPAYISEIAPAQYRGRLTSLQQIAIIIGLFSAFINNYFLANLAGSSTTVFWFDFEAWRWMFWMELIPASLFFLLLFFIPESPRYLVASQQTAAAHQVLSKLYGSAVARDKVSEISQSLDNDRHGTLGFSGLLAKGSGLKTVVWIGLGLAIFQQLVGINVVFYYGAVLWQAVGFAESDALLINIISGGVSILACLITMKFIDKLGRKPFLLIGSVGMSVCLAVMVATFLNASVDSSGNLDLGTSGALTLIAANAYVFFFNLSWGPVMWVMLGEMFPNNIRGSGLAVSGLAQWGSNFLITISFPILLTTIGLAGAYGLYLLGAVISIVFVAVMVRETKGIELEQMK